MGEGELISANKRCAVAFLNSVQWSKGGELWWNLKLDSQLILVGGEKSTAVAKSTADSQRGADNLLKFKPELRWG